MGDMSEMRGLIIVITFLGVIFGFLFYMPSEYLRGYSTNQINDIKIANLLMANTTLTYNFAGTDAYRSPAQAIGGWYITITETYPFYANGSDDKRNSSKCFQLEITDAITWLNYYYNREDFKWYDNNTQQISVRKDIATFQHSVLERAEHEVITMSSLNLYQDNLVFTCKSSRTTITIAFYFDSSVYYSPEDAYNNMALSLEIGVDINNQNTQVNSWGFIFSLLFWQDVPFIDPMTLLMIRTPISVALGYMLFIFVLRVIGSVFGGGGA